jgi:hypothetical protein
VNGIHAGLQSISRPLRHDSRRMEGRDSHETQRVATPLELLFDPTFATSFGLAACQLAEALAAGRYAAAMLGFGFATFAMLGLDQFLLVFFGLRHRRLAIPDCDHGADGRRPRAGHRPASDVRVHRAGPTPGQFGHGPWLRHHALPLHLCESTIHEQFDSRDVAAIVGCEAYRLSLGSRR